MPVDVLEVDADRAAAGRRGRRRPAPSGWADRPTRPALAWCARWWPVDRRRARRAGRGRGRAATGPGPTWSPGRHGRVRRHRLRAHAGRSAAARGRWRPTGPGTWCRRCPTAAATSRPHVALDSLAASRLTDQRDRPGRARRRRGPGRPAGGAGGSAGAPGGLARRSDAAPTADRTPRRTCGSCSDPGPPPSCWIAAVWAVSGGSCCGRSRLDSPIHRQQGWSGERTRGSWAAPRCWPSRSRRAAAPATADPRPARPARSRPRTTKTTPRPEGDQGRRRRSARSRAARTTRAPS